MVRIRSGWLVALVALGLGASACKKNDDSKGGPASADKATDKGMSGDKAGGGPAAVADDLSLLPADSELVMGINFAQLQQSALWKQFAPMFMDKLQAGLGDFKAACGFDPLEAFKSISMGMKGLTGATPEGAFVIHGPEKSKVMACIDKARDEASKKGSELKIDGDTFIVKDPKGQSVAFQFVGDTALLGIIGPNATKDGLTAAAKGGSTLKTSATFVDMYSKINTKDSLWLLMNGNSPALQKAPIPGLKLKALYGSVNVTDGLAMDLRMRVGSPDEASNFVNTMKGQINNPQVKNYVDKLDVTADASDVKIAVAMSNQKLQQLIGMVGAMMGGMMGGMGGP